MTKYFDMKNEIKEEEIKEAGKMIKNGELVIFPTETVYGIGANGLNSNAVRNIFIAKGRAQDNPLILHISDIDMIDDIATDINEIERKIIDIFFPGPLTIILKKKDIVPSVVSGELDTVGIRMPSNKIANTLIKFAGVPIAAPSANISGKPSGTTLNDIKEEFDAKMEKYHMEKAEVKPQSSATTKKFEKQFLKTDTGIEINIPMEQYQDINQVEFISNPDGTISVMIKNINKISTR